METGEIYILEAKTTVLATGGAGRIWAASTNAFINTGDGLGMAARAGIPLQDMEFWQFHPTGVAGAGVLITEGVRGEGGILLNKDGERFMERYAPTLKDLAPRDFVSRSMDQEIKEGRGCGPDGSYVVLKLDHLGADVINKRLPSIREIAIKFGNVDPIKEPIPVVPTIHYQMGGIPANYHGQVLTRENGENKIVNGLYAIGECAAVSVHGANRLGTNSLLDLIVFGRATGNHIVNSHPEHQHSHQPVPQQAVEFSLDRVNKLESRTSGEKTQDIGNAIRFSMQRHCGVFRTLELLNEGVTQIEDLAKQADNIYFKDKSKVFNTARVEALELANMTEVARATIKSAANRTESRGACAGRPPDPRRRELAEAHAVVLRRQPPGLQARADEAADGRVLPAQGAYLLSPDRAYYEHQENRQVRNLPLRSGQGRASLHAEAGSRASADRQDAARCAGAHQERRRRQPGAAPLVP